MAKFVLREMTRALETDGAAGRKGKQVHLAPQNWTLTDVRSKWLCQGGKNSGSNLPEAASCQEGCLNGSHKGCLRDAPALF